MKREINSIIEALFAESRKVRWSAMDEYITSLREEAMSSFLSHRLPTLKEEDYKYSDIKGWFSELFEREALGVLVSSGFVNQYTGGAVVCDINTFASEYSDIFRSYYTRSVEDNSLMMLSRAFAEDGNVIYIPKGAICNEVITLDIKHAKGEALLGERNLIIVERGALAKIHIKYHNEAFVNGVTEVFLQSGANVEIFEEYNGSKESVYINTISVNMDKDAFYKHVTFGESSGRCRVNEVVSLLGKGSEASIYGAVKANGEAHIDNYTLIKHQVERCRSFEHFKCIANSASTSIFNGNIYVAAGANGTEAYQQNNNILLSDNASIYTKPNLEIYADDVKCSHGATTGQLSEDALFYMKQRGVSQQAAKELLLAGFVMEIVEKSSMRAVVEEIRERINR